MIRLAAALASLLFAALPTAAETVEVKYRGLVDLDAFVCPAIRPSSFVNRLCYDEPNAYLVVQLKQTYYHYCELPKTVFEEWLAAPSLGRFYKPKHQGERL